MMKSLGAKPLLYPAPVLVVGTYNKNGTPNVMTAAWGGICCSQPPCVSVSLRKVTHSHNNILERHAFTISIPSEKHVKEVYYFGLVTGKTAEKFAATKLTPVKSKLVDAPYVKEFLLVMECKLVHKADLGLHTLFVGEVIDAKADESIIGNCGAIDVKKLNPMVFTPDTQDYYGVGKFVGKVFSAGKGI